MVTKEEISARLAKAREPIKTMEKEIENPVIDEETSDEEGSVIDDEISED